MRKILLVPALLICLGFASCKKEEIKKPDCEKSKLLPVPKDKLIM